MAENSKSYWLPELPPAEDRLAEADAKLARQFYQSCLYEADCYSTSRLLKTLFWYVVTVGVLAACVWGALWL